MAATSGARTVAGTGVLAVALLVGGCSSSEPSADPAPQRPSTTSPSAPAGTTSPDPDPSDPAPSEEPPRRYRPLRAEVDPEAKRVAARAVEALPDVRRVTFTQYFGYLPPAGNILVEAELGGGGGTTYAVPVSRDERGWRAERPEPAATVPPLADPGPLVRRVLASDRIDLNAAGRVDVAGGLVADSVLRSMLAVAEEHRIEVSVLVSAHPVNVFGTDRRSNHPDGLAYDVGSIDGRLVVDPDAAGIVREVMRLAATTGAYQVGGPEDLDGGGSQYFADLTHSDHVHVGFTA